MVKIGGWLIEENYKLIDPKILESALVEGSTAGFIGFIKVETELVIEKIDIK